MSRSPGFDLRSYLERIGFDGEPGNDLATLEALHLKHLDRIPFENIDVFLGRPAGLDLETLQSKVVQRERGGYCFEQNSLFAGALRALGYRVATLEARVRPPGATAPLPRTHMLLLVSTDGQDFAADVGFGGDGPLRPVPVDGTPSEQPDGVYRVDRENDAIHAMRLLQNGVWRDLYAFTLTPAEAVDFEVAHHFTSTHPRSPFVRTLTVQRSSAAVRRILRGRSYTERGEGGERTREIRDEELGPLLESEFGLTLGEDSVQAVLHRLNRTATDT